jgi:hypothetical protein
MPLCSKPYIAPGAQPAPCGQCPGCLTNRKQLWTHRIILESLAHEKNSFITLTYSDENLPLNGEGVPTLVKEDLQLFLKRLRAKLIQKIRYYAVGEYGTNGSRGINPHFHLCIFGMGEEGAQAVHEAWTTSQGRGSTGNSLGHTLTGVLTPQSAAYVAGYVQKKTKYNQDMYEELDIEPEFATMSNRPGIGLHAAKIIAKTLEANPEGLTPVGDVPTSIMHGSRRLPLGKYLREKIREELNLDHDLETWIDEFTGEIHEKKIWHAKERQKDLYKEDMRILQENEENDPKLPEDAKASLKHALQYRDGQAILNFETKQKIFQTRKTL